MNTSLKKMALSLVAICMFAGQQVECKNDVSKKKEKEGYTVWGVVSKGFSVAKTAAGTVVGAALVYALPANLRNKQVLEDKLSDANIQTYFEESNEHAKKVGLATVPNTPENITQFKQRVLMIHKAQVGVSVVFAAIGAYIIYRTWAPEPTEE